MRVLYRHPESCHNERRYIVTWLFEEVLGWQVDCRAEERDDQQFEVEGENGSLNLPDSFFGMAEDRWLSRQTMPQEPLVERQGLPALYGSGATIDVLGSLFFLLSRGWTSLTRSMSLFLEFPTLVLTVCQDNSSSVGSLRTVFRSILGVYLV